MKTKRCSACKRRLGLARFHLRAGGPGGRQARCRECRRSLERGRRGRPRLLYPNCTALTPRTYPAALRAQVAAGSVLPPNGEG
jgi:hypothetical protein